MSYTFDSLQLPDNFYPTNRSIPGKLGYFVSQHESEAWSVGVVYKIQLGIGFTVK